MPDIALDFSSVHPTIDELTDNDVKVILVYSRVSTPTRDYLETAVARGIGVCMIFETEATRAFAGFDAGRSDGDEAERDLVRIGVPDGVRLYVNMADTPNVADHEQAIADYARGFAQTFPDRWRLGCYGPLAALRAAQKGSARFDALWGVETWHPTISGRPQHDFSVWAGERDVVLVQMANVAPPIAATDTNWIVEGADLGAWGGDDMPSAEEVAAATVKALVEGHDGFPSPLANELLRYHTGLIAPAVGFDGHTKMRLLDWIHLSDLTTTRAALDDALRTLPGGEAIDVDQLTAAFVEKLKERLEA